MIRMGLCTLADVFLKLTQSTIGCFLYFSRLDQYREPFDLIYCRNFVRRTANSAVEACLMRWMHYQLHLFVRRSPMLLQCWCR